MRVSIILVALVTVAAAACGGSDSSTTTPVTPTTNKTVDVFTVSTAFSPTLVTLNAGDTVRYNIVPASDGSGHDVTFDATAGAPANIPVTLRGTISRVFATRGTYHYNCFVHPGMSGDVTVQ